MDIFLEYIEKIFRLFDYTFFIHISFNYILFNSILIFIYFFIHKVSFAFTHMFVQSILTHTHTHTCVCMKHMKAILHLIKCFIESLICLYYVSVKRWNYFIVLFVFFFFFRLKFNTIHGSGRDFQYCLINNLVNIYL